MSATVVVPAVASLVAVNSFYWTRLAADVQDVVESGLPWSARKIEDARGCATKWLVVMAGIVLLHIIGSIPIVIVGVEAVTTIGRSDELDVVRVGGVMLAAMAVGAACLLIRELRRVSKKRTSLSRTLDSARRPDRPSTGEASTSTTSDTA